MLLLLTSVTSLEHLQVKGYAKPALSAMTQLTLAQHLGIQYQTLLSNQASLRTAEALGFTTFAERVSLRLKD